MRRSFFAAGLVLVVPTLPFLSLACAKSTTIFGNDTGGAGGSGGTSVTTSSSSSGSSTSSAGGGGGVPTSCTGASDCVALSDACNVGTCINGMCAKTPANDFGSCDDGEFCTDNDTCQSGQCVGGTQKLCPGSDSCHIGACDEPSQSCTSVPGNDGASCDDGDPCTSGGFCSAGTCSKGAPIDCSFLNGTCTAGVCDPVLGCIAKPVADGTACDDGLYCTVNDQCKSGTCGGQPNTCAAPGDVCMVGSCNEVMKSCVAVPGNNGGACDDKNACTTGEKCSNGTCGGGLPANQGGACSDGNACTTGDVCNGNGQCAGTAITSCINGDGCCPPGCNLNNDTDCKAVKVDVIGQGATFYTDELRAYLAAQPFIAKADSTADCNAGTLAQYDVVVVWGNMDGCSNLGGIDTWVNGGGGIVGTPWIFNNDQGMASMPVQGSTINTHFSDPLDVTVTDPSDVLLQGVVFVAGNSVGWEEWNFTLKPGATNSVIWAGQPNHYAVAKWTYGSGRATYLDFHYITSDCSRAIAYPWGKQLVYNAVLWAGKAL